MPIIKLLDMFFSGYMNDVNSLCPSFVFYVVLLMIQEAAAVSMCGNLPMKTAAS